jgi:hypothetical protein
VSPHCREISTSGLLAAIAAGDGHSSEVTFDELLQRFSQRAFGVMVLVATLPAFLPLPAGAGAISGPLITLFGAQMLVGLRAPWVPARLRRRGIRRERFARFAERMRPWLQRVERGVKPRLAGFTQHPACHVLSGLLLLLLGLLLSLPIPLTNYPVGLLILAFAVALIERDGVLLIAAWLLGSGALVATALLSGDALALLRGWLA